MKTVENLIHVTSNYRSITSTSSSSAHLVILSENIPKSTEADVNVRVMSPPPDEILPLSTLTQPSSSSIDEITVSDEMLIDKVMEYERLQPSYDKKLKVFISPSTNNIFWVKWLEPGEGLSLSFKYQISWPDERQIHQY